MVDLSSPKALVGVRFPPSLPPDTFIFQLLICFLADETMSA